MPATMGISLHRLVLSLSEALDWVRPESADCRQRLAYVAIRLAKQMGFPDSSLQDLFLAATLQKSVLAGLSHSLQIEAAGAGSASGDVLESVAWINRSYRTRWDHGRGAELGGRSIPQAGQILLLAEGVARLVDRSIPVLAQAESIIKQVAAGSGKIYHEDCVAAFKDLAMTESFWLDCVSLRLHSQIAERIDWAPLPIGHAVVRHIAKVFGEIVDSLSRWTSGHSAAVAATAVELAAGSGFGLRRQVALRLAAWLHDLGKLSVPVHVLDKEDRLSRQEWAVVRGHPYYTYQILHSTDGPAEVTEWASYHHERIDGKGYPFALSGRELSIGSRIMAVADTYTAVMQDRPYRARMEAGKAVALLGYMAANGALDGDIVELLMRNRDQIELVRQQAQSSSAPADKADAASQGIRLTEAT